MKAIRYFSGAVLALIIFCGGCTGKPPRAHYEKAGRFSYDPPKNWQIVEFPGLKYRISAGASENGFAPNMNIVDERFGGSLTDYVDLSMENVKKTFKNFDVLKKEDFKTDDGLPAVRVVAEDTQQGERLRQTFCFFGDSSRKYVVTCTALAKGGEKLDTVFEESTKTFRIH